MPAIRALKDVELHAVAASTLASARAAADLFQVPLAFGSAADLAACADVDLAVVAVRVDKHADTVLPAIDAGKAVLCEWPLGRTLDEARELEGRARAAGVPALVGLQARSSPVVRYVADLIAGGQIGRVLSSSIIASGLRWGATFDDGREYQLDADSGATLITIPVAHTLDALQYVLGEFTELSAWTAIRHPVVTNVQTGSTRKKTAPDQVIVTGTVGDGAIVNAHFRGGACLASNFHWEINGTQGDLVLRSDRPNFWMGETAILGVTKTEQGLRALKVPEAYESRVPSFAGRDSDPAYNVAFAYANVIDDLRTGTRQVPTFRDAVELHRLVSRIERAAATGRRA